MICDHDASRINTINTSRSEEQLISTMMDALWMSDAMRYLPTLTIFLSSLLNIQRWEKFLAKVNARQWIVIHLMCASLLFALPPHSAVASFGRALTFFIAQWPTLFPEAPIALIHGGPLGHSCAKGEDKLLITASCCPTLFPP
jgi:hypothetical protein